MHSATPDGGMDGDCSVRGNNSFDIDALAGEFADQTSTDAAHWHAWADGIIEEYFEQNPPADGSSSWASELVSAECSQTNVSRYGVFSLPSNETSLLHIPAPDGLPAIGSSGPSERASNDVATADTGTQDA